MSAAKSLMAVLAATDDHLQAMQHYGHSHDLREAMSTVQDLLEAARTYAMRYAQDEAAEDGPEHTGCSEQQACDARALFAALAKATGAV